MMSNAAGDPLVAAGAILLVLFILLSPVLEKFKSKRRKTRWGPPTRKTVILTYDRRKVRRRP